MTNLKGTFYVQFKRQGSGIVAQKLTQSKSRTPRGSGAISVRLQIEIPSWVFDPLDLVAQTIVPAQNTEPVIRLSSVGPVSGPDGNPASDAS